VALHVRHAVAPQLEGDRAPSDPVPRTIWTETEAVGYYTRVLSKRHDCLSLDSLRDSLGQKFPTMVLSLQDGDPGDWTALLLAHADGLEIAAIERNPVADGTLGADELAEFIEEVEAGQPHTAVTWLSTFLSSVRSIYAFQHLSGTRQSRGDEALRSVSTAIWAKGEAILQADGEGFSNEDGYHILWQFSDDVSGPWWMAVLQDGRWVRFQMDLGSSEHRRAFLEGKVPPGVQTA
jgi:hypothetical protein